MLTIIFCWLLFFILIYLVGRLVAHPRLLSFIDIKGDLEWYQYFWVGLTVIVGILQIWSLALPVNRYSLLFVIFLATISLILTYRKASISNGGAAAIKFVKNNISLLVIGSTVLLAISYSASLSVGWEDTLLYHLNAVKWNNLYSVVPGLTNLHLRLGVSSSLFLFASMIETWFLKDRSAHLALSLLASVISIEFIWVLFKTNVRVIKIFIILTLPLLVSCILRRTLVASLSPDFALIIIALALSYEVLKGDLKSLLVAAFLSMLLFTIKLSSVPFVVVILFYSISKFFRLSRKSFLKILGFIVFLGLFMLVPYMVRDYYLSGWLFYPLPLFEFNVDWAVPRERVEAMSTVIKSWAIMPGPGWRTQVGLSFWEWFPGWYTRNSWTIEMKMFFLCASLLIISPLMKLKDKTIRLYRSNFLLLLISSLAGVFFMLFTAPDFRFGEVYFWILFAIVISYFSEEILSRNLQLRNVFIILVAYFIFTITWPIRIESEPILKSVRWEPTFPVEKFLITPSDGSPTFFVLKPTDSELCANSDLPCAPVPEDLKIKERVPGDISKGYAPVR